MRQRDDLVFSMPEYERRLRAVREEMVRRKLDATLVTTPENIFYLTGYQTTGYFVFQALVVPLAREPFMVIRLLEQTNVDARSWIDESHAFSDTEDPITVLRMALMAAGLGTARLGYEKQSWFFRAHEQEQLFSSLRDAEFIDASGVIEGRRLIKSEEELRWMRGAARYTELGIRAGMAAVRPGATENDVAAEIHHAMIKGGSDYPAVAPFVGAGWRGALGHTTWEGKPIAPDEPVFIEVGGCARRYHAAMMRVALHGEPSPALQEAERLIQEAMQAAMGLIRPGVSTGDVDAQSRYILDRYSFGGRQSTRSGYSIGIAFAPDWGEGHILDIKAGGAEPLAANMTFHLIPWIQMPGQFGIGLSETVRVTQDGCEPLLDVERKVFVN